jgi:hypothetical protein
VTDEAVRAAIHRIIQLSRNPNAPDVLSLEEKPSAFGHGMVKCPACGSWEYRKQFYSHWSRDHEPDWKVNMLLELIKSIDTITLT